HRVAVMYKGRIVEEADCDPLFDNPLHPYTKKLLSAIPLVDPEDRRKRKLLVGDWREENLSPEECPFCESGMETVTEESAAGCVTYHIPEPSRRVLCLRAGE
ncbi:MAG: dipeptide/oligopeptide/nickel ABC transporter ATP-binding protein, partial [Planctomycetes bacterium]|nr:dipeptide/oligopeptide/nickel ABC transporter ATP-binding protein [Planctomycetota bacterium]